MTAPRGPRRFRRRWIALGVVVLLTFVSVRSLDRSAPIFYFRVVNDRTLVLGSVSGPGTWTRPTRLEEGADTVTLGVNSLTAPLPGYGDGAATCDPAATAGQRACRLNGGRKCAEGCGCAVGRDEKTIIG